MLLCIVDYYSKFTVEKKMGSLAADDLVQMVKMIFAEYQHPKKDSFGHKHKYTIRNIKRVLQDDEHPPVDNIILPPPDQWQSRVMHYNV